MPRLPGSPRIRSAPQRGLSAASCRTRATDAGGSGGRPGVGFPPPARPEPRAVPPQQRLRPDEEEGLPPSANPHGEQHEERPIRPRHRRARDAAAQGQHPLAQQGVLGEELWSAPQQSAPGPGRVYPDHRSRPPVGAQGVPHARDEAGQATTARPPDQHHSIPPRSAQQSTNGTAAPLGHDSRRERRHQHRELRAREQPGWLMSQHNCQVKGARLSMRYRTHE